MKRMLFSGVCLGMFLFTGIAARGVATGAEFHVGNGADFQAALDEAASNGEDDVIYLNFGVYRDCFYYVPPSTEHRDLTIRGEPGTRPEDVVLDGSEWPWSPPLLLNDYDYDDEFGPVADVTIQGLTVQNGQSESGAMSGGMDIRMFAYNVTVRNCIIQNNSGQDVGGGLRIETLYNVVMENTRVLGNTLGSPDERWVYGGGVFINGVWLGDIVLRNNVIAGNAACCGSDETSGGGLYIGGYACSMGPSIYLINNTIHGNACAGDGGGVYVYAGRNLYAYNNIVYGNTGATGDDIYVNVVPADRVSRDNNYSDQAGSAWTEEALRMNAEPLFVSPSRNDYHLNPGSPMRDAGAAVVPDPPGLPSTDLDGAPRVTGAAPDIGAYEFRAVPRPHIRLNGSEVFIERTNDYDTLRFDLSLDNAGLSTNADWWLMMISPYGVHFATLEGWTTSWLPWFQWPLFFVDNFSTYDMPLTGWLPGYYLFFFAVDTVQDGAYTTGSAYYDYIGMRITE